MDPHFIFAHSRAALEGHATNETIGSTPDPGLENLYPALVECFGIIILGFIAGKCNFINDVEAKGLGTFVGTFSLPALIFVSLCQIKLDTVNWKFLAAVSTAKSVVFFSVLAIGIVSQGMSKLSASALYAIFCTQSNDFALGFPVLTAIYGTTHPDYPMYLYLLAPVSLAVLNPIGFVLMEIGRNNDNNNDKWKIFTKVLKSILTNPLIFMTILGILGNLLFHASMPKIIQEFMGTLGSAFSASALFLLGLRMVGQAGSMDGEELVLPFVLIVVKSLFLPLVTREVISQFGAGSTNTTEDLANYGFLYGTIPTAPSVFVYASTYNIKMDMIAASITASTFMAAPIMFISAKLLMVHNLDPSDYMDEIEYFLLDISVIGLIAALWVIFVLVVTKKVNSIPHQITAVLAFTQGVGCLGAILWSLLDCRHGWRLYVQFIIFGYGVFGSRITTAALAITLTLQSASSSWVVRHKKMFVSGCLTLPLFLVLLLTTIVSLETDSHGDKLDPNFQYGKTQAVTALVVLIISLLTTVVSLVLQYRNTDKTLNQRMNSERARLIPSPGGRSRHSTDESRLSMDDSLPVCGGPETTPTCGGTAGADLEDIIPRTPNNGVCLSVNGGTRRYRCDSTHREYCSNLVRRYEVPPAEDALSPDNVLAINTTVSALGSSDANEDPLQLVRHRLLLLLLCISMFVGGALCIWTLLMEKMSGIYLEMVFLDGFLNLGQSIFTLALFGVNTKGLLLNVRGMINRLMYGRDQIKLPAWEDLNSEDRNISTRFIKHHLEICMEQLLHDINEGLSRYNAAFYGSELIDWLIEFGLAQTRQEAESFGRHLLRGRVISHVHGHLDFYDARIVYTFLPEDRRLR